MTNEQRSTIQKLQLTSDIFFSVVLEDIHACQEVISIITGENITLTKVRNQETLLQLATHSIRIDVWATDTLSRHIGLEMHPQSDEDRVKRNRYTLSSLDIRNLDKGKAYQDIPDVCGIYITTADFLRTQKGINKVDRIIHNTDIPIPNGISEYYVSLSCAGDTPAQTELLNYIKNSDGILDNKHFPHLVKRVRFLKEQQQGGDIMCEIIDQLVKDGEKRGIIATLQELDFTPDDICKHLIVKFHISEATAREYMNMV